MGASALEDICNLALLRAGLNVRISSIDDLNANAQACKTTAGQTRQSLYTEFRWAFTIKRVLLTPYAGVAYDATRVFAKGDLSQYGDNVYRSLLDANLNHQPDKSPAWWAQVTRDGWGFCAPVPADMMSPISMWEAPSTSSTTGVNLGDPDDDQDMLVIRAPTPAERQPFVIENANDGTDNEIILTDLDTPVLKYVADVTNPSAMHPKFIQTYAWHMSIDFALGRGELQRAVFCEKQAAASLGDAFTVVMRDQQEDMEPPSEFERARRGEI